MRRPMALWRQAVIAAALIGAGAALWSERVALGSYIGVAATQPEDETRGQRGRRGGRDARPAPVIVAEAASRADDLTIELVGTARAARSAALRVAGAGEVTRSRLTAGRRVSAGETLLALEDAAATLAVDLARARKEAAERALDRALRLERSGATSDAALDAARTEATLAEIELRRAERERADMTLRAPFDGVLGLPSVEVGDWVERGDAVGVVDDRATLLIEADLPETLLPRAALGDRVTLSSVSAPGARFSGAIVAIDSRIAPETRTARVRVAVDNPDDALRPGASFAMTFAFSGPDYPAAPELALQYGREGLYVWRVTDDVAERAAARLVRRQAGVVLLEGLDEERPLAAGDLIVVEGAQRLRPGRAVTQIGAPMILDAHGAAE